MVYGDLEFTFGATAAATVQSSEQDKVCCQSMSCQAVNEDTQDRVESGKIKYSKATESIHFITWIFPSENALVILSNKIGIWQTLLSIIISV